MRVVKGAVDRSLQAIELLAREARWMRMSDIAAELELEKGPAQPCSHNCASRVGRSRTNRRPSTV